MADQKCAISDQLKHPLNEHCSDAKHAVAATAAATDGSSSWLSSLGLVFLSFNCGVAIYHSRHDPSSAAFVAASFVILLLVFYFLRLFETLPRGSPRRLHVKAAVWVLTTTLTVMFSHRVAALMPSPMAVVVWAMAGSTILAGFCMLFVFRDRVSADNEKLPKVAEGP